MFSKRKTGEENIPESEHFFNFSCELAAGLELRLEPDYVEMSERVVVKVRIRANTLGMNTVNEVPNKYAEVCVYVCVLAAPLSRNISV